MSEDKDDLPAYAAIDAAARAALPTDPFEGHTPTWLSEDVWHEYLMRVDPDDMTPRDSEARDILIADRASLLSTLRDQRERLARIETEAKNRIHYSDNPRTTLHSWNQQESLEAVGGFCGLCAALSTLRDQREREGRLRKLNGALEDAAQVVLDTIERGGFADPEDKAAYRAYRKLVAALSTLHPEGPK